MPNDKTDTPADRPESTATAQPADTRSTCLVCGQGIATAETACSRCGFTPTEDDLKRVAKGEQV